MDMKEAGMREREVQMLYSLNKRGEIKIETHVGETKEIEVKRMGKPRDSIWTIDVFC